jgi:hypothetical protein
MTFCRTCNVCSSRAIVRAGPFGAAVRGARGHHSPLKTPGTGPGTVETSRRRRQCPVARHTPARGRSDSAAGAANVERAHDANETSKGVAKGTEKGAKVTAYYTEDAGKKIAHFFKM